MLQWPKNQITNGKEWAVYPVHSWNNNNKKILTFWQVCWLIISILINFALSHVLTDQIFWHMRSFLTDGVEDLETRQMHIFIPHRILIEELENGMFQDLYIHHVFVYSKCCLIIWNEHFLVVKFTAFISVVKYMTKHDTTLFCFFSLKWNIHHQLTSYKPTNAHEIS